MQRAAAIVSLYAFAFLAIYAGFALAPDMAWPVTPREYNAAAFLILGSAAKLIGHWLLLVTR